MNNREFNALLKKWSNKKTKRLDLKKVQQATNEEKQEALLHIVSGRGAVLQELVNPLTDRGWLASMGYLYYGKSRCGTYSFHATSANMGSLVEA